MEVLIHQSSLGGVGVRCNKTTKVICKNDEPLTSFSRDLNAGRLVLSAYLNSSYMNWDGGSALIFWRWPPTLQAISRDGFPSNLLHPLPNNMTHPKRMKESDRLRLLEKL